MVYVVLTSEHLILDKGSIHLKGIQTLIIQAILMFFKQNLTAIKTLDLFLLQFLFIQEMLIILRLEEKVSCDTAPLNF